MTAAPLLDRLPVGLVALVIGNEMPEYRIGPLTRTDFVRYAGAGGDLNPIHHDEPLAQRAGMRSVFGMGMLQAGVLGVRLARWVGPLNIRSFSVRFTGQVWPGDELVFRGRVADVVNTGDESYAELELSVTRAGQEMILRATARTQVAGVQGT